MHIVIIAHVWPGISYLNVGQLTYRQWLVMRGAAKEYMREAAKSRG
jgi:hypothetical protein